MKKKIVKFFNIEKLSLLLKKKGKKIVHCHGVFDLLHIGHLKHFKSAKKFGDILIVSITPDKFVHKGLNQNINFSSYKTILLDNGTLQYTEAINKEEALDIPLGTIDSEKNIYAYYYWLFPNIMLNFYSWGLSINIIEPINKNKTRIRFLSYPIHNKTQPKKLNSSLDKAKILNM